MWGPALDPGLVERCRVYAQTLSLGEETRTPLPNDKGMVLRIRFYRGEESVVRTEVRTLLTTRVLVDLKPMGAVLVLLETAKQRTPPRRLVLWTGERAGEYADGAIEAAWGAIVLEGGGNTFLGMRFPRDPRRLHLQDVVGLAESAL